MKIFDYVKASKAKKTLGNEFTKDIDAWKQKHKQMVEEFNNSSYKSIQLKSDVMPAEQLIFYNLSGSKVLNEYSIFSIDTTVIDNAYDFTKGEAKLTRKEKENRIKEVEKEMREAARQLDFERAATLRDILFELKSE